MRPFSMAEVFGYDLFDSSKVALQGQRHRWCPFKEGPCRKGSARDPLGICSLSDGKHLAVLCPFRFVQEGLVFREVATIAFGRGIRFVVAPELQILRVRSEGPQGPTERRVGKVDYLIAKVGGDEKLVDFAALEVQAVYFSGHSLRPSFRHFLRHRAVPDGSQRRPDWRSSAQKRLMPQLSLKIPVFRRWGKKFFVAVDAHFFRSLPDIKPVDSIANSEITFIVYPFPRSGKAYAMGRPSVRFSTWEDVLTALREGEAPDPSEILAEIERKRTLNTLAIHTT